MYLVFSPVFCIVKINKIIILNIGVLRVTNKKRKEPEFKVVEKVIYELNIVSLVSFLK